jgi:hypothetical protein
MDTNYHFIEEYRGYFIYRTRTSAGYMTDYFCICDGGIDHEKVTQMYMASPLACRNVIDTFERAKLRVNGYPSNTLMIQTEKTFISRVLSWKEYILKKENNQLILQP